MLRPLLRALARPLIWGLKPIKIAAYRGRHHLLGRLVLEITTFLDWLSVFALVQNHVVRIHGDIYGGNFVFGKALMVVDHATASEEIPQAMFRGSHFMGVALVTDDPGVFATNAPILTSGPPVHDLVRNHLESEIMTPKVRAIGVDSLTEDAAHILKDWAADPRQATWTSVRGVATRLILFALTGRTFDKRTCDELTFAYFRRFGEICAFARYFPFMLGILGTRERMRRDAYVPLTREGVDPFVVDMTLFAAMFSIGTIVFHSINFCREFEIDYRSLSPAERMIFVVEAQRLFPTVTTVHRIVQAEERKRLGSREVALLPGDEVAYPFVCINRDPRHFGDAANFRLDRSREEFDKVLSWSKGPRDCPAKDLSIVVTTLILSGLAEVHDLRELRIFAPEI